LDPQHQVIRKQSYRQAANSPHGQHLVLASVVPDEATRGINHPLPGQDASSPQGKPQQFVASTHLYTWVERDNPFTLIVSYGDLR